MPFQLPPRLSSILASVLAAGLMLTAAGCAGQITPLGPGTPPAPHRLRSPITLQALRAQPPKPAGGCPAGSAALPGGLGQCYRKLGAPVTFTSAAVAVATLTRAQVKTPSGQPPGPASSGPPSYGFTVALPVSDTAALTTVTTTAADAHGYLAVSVGGRTWCLPKVLQPFTHPQFQIFLPNGNQSRQLRRLLVPSG